MFVQIIVDEYCRICIRYYSSGTFTTWITDDKKQDQLVVHVHELRNTLDEVDATIQTVEKLPERLEHKVMVFVSASGFTS